MERYKGGSGQHIHPNMKKYLRPPSQELIREVFNNAGVSQNQFARYYGIPYTIVSHCLCSEKNRRPVPAKYWHIFYESNPKKIKELKEKTPARKPDRPHKAAHDTEVKEFL
jgi:hypothetical protein